MILAFVFATFGLGDVLRFALAHVVSLGALGVGSAAVAAIALEIFVPGSIPLIRAALSAVMRGLQWLVGTTSGHVVLLAGVCLFAGWQGRAVLDRSIALEAALATQRRAALAAEQAAARARLQAAALDQANAAASRRAVAAENERDDLQEQLADYSDRLDAQAKDAPSGAGGRCTLTAADVAALNAIGIPRRTP